MSKIDKSKLPSRHVSIGPASAPHRSYYYAMGMTEQEIAQPFVGVVTTWNEAAPCNISLSRKRLVTLILQIFLRVIQSCRGHH